MDRISRRALLSAAGTGGVAIAAPALTRASFAAAPPSPTPAPARDRVCFVMPDVVDGPYYESRALIRRDITEGKPGIPLEIRVRVVDASCRPLADARVDCWHADARGVYSNYPHQGDGLDVSTVGETFLRGTQMTDKDGWVSFRSIYPGWYSARTTHVHFKIHIGGRVRLTTQMFFPDALSEYIYLNAPDYLRPVTRDTVNVTDWILAKATRHAMATVREEADRYVAEVSFGVDPAATPVIAAKMQCPEGRICAVTPNTPPDPAERVEALLPSTANARRPPAQPPAIPD